MTKDALKIDMRVMELLASRLCHDLVGPIGAVNNGLELMADEEFGMADDALALASKSAAQAANLLQFYRMAYGSAGGRQGADLSVFRDLAEGLLANLKCQLRWADPTPGVSVPEACGKILLNLIVMAAESLPRGGAILTALGRDSGGFRIAVAAQGEDAALREESAAAMTLEVDIDDLTPRNVHSHFTSLLIQRSGGTFTHQASEPGRVTFNAVLP